MEDEPFESNDLFKSLFLEILGILKFDVFLYFWEKYVYVISFGYYYFICPFKVEYFL